MELKEKDIKSKSKVGRKGGDDVYSIATKGGLHIVVVAKSNGKTEILGAGPHKAIAQFIAEKGHDDLEWISLTKSDYVPDIVRDALLPKYEKLTNELCELAKLRD